ncbi:MAG: AmmeMemoRadiSam system radical SAM enzyme [Firmicutes bacterium]|nr:AmmeMemoRadiSam system radical SAM enzyme [Bacillota bacterium]MCL5040461.1 AmmeMemoRadiSam system radical SAM enzyme [Bacillota bacterium]
MQEALFYEKLAEGRVQCRLCPQQCRIAPGRHGICRVRKNVDGTLYSTNYGQTTSYAVDPTEKKPLYHFYPGSYLFSLGTLGCNFRCDFCQNWQISQQDAPAETLLPREALRLSEEVWRREPRTIGIAYTYSEPSVWYEYVLDTARLARATGLKNVLVTNGYIEREPLAELLPVVDAMNVDVKAFSDDYYRRVCGGHLDPVLRTVEQAHQAGVHVEVTTLVVPALNDSDEEIGALVEWLAEVGEEIPYHLSRYFPNYQMDLPATPTTTLKRLRDLASQKLRYVYVGNLPSEGNNTYCYSCGALLLRRDGLGVAESHLRDGHRCPRCGVEIDIRGQVMVS